jgi:2-methylcitrate dehydratase PrpD
LESKLPLSFLADWGDKMKAVSVGAPNYKSPTDVLAAYVAGAQPTALPKPVQKEATRSFLNWVGCAIGGARHEAVNIALAALSPFSGPAEASVLGRSERLDVLHAALINGISSHIFDFDDTVTLT